MCLWKRWSSPFRVFPPLGKGTHLENIVIRICLVQVFTATRCTWKITPDSFLCNSMFAQLSSPMLLRGFLLTSHKFKRSTVLQVPEKRTLQLQPQQITPKDALLIYIKNVKDLPQLFALAFPMALPPGTVWGTCWHHTGDTWVFGFLRSSLPDISQRV